MDYSHDDSAAINIDTTHAASATSASATASTKKRDDAKERCAFFMTKIKKFLMSLSKRQAVNVVFGFILLVEYLLFLISTIISIFFWIMFLITLVTVVSYFAVVMIVEEIATRNERKAKATAAASATYTTTTTTVPGFSIDYEADQHAPTAINH